MNIDIIEEIINTINEEIEQSNNSYYVCKDGTKICTDVGYVYDWFNEYKDVLRRKFSLTYEVKPATSFTINIPKPCSDCNIGYMAFTTEGIISCEDNCEKLKSWNEGAN